MFHTEEPPSSVASTQPIGNNFASVSPVNHNTNNNDSAKSTASTTIFVGDLSVFCTEDDLTKLFRQYGNFKDVRIIRENKSHQPLFYGFVEFFDHASAQQAMSVLNGHLFMGRSMRVSWATAPSSPRVNVNDSSKHRRNEDDSTSKFGGSQSESSRSLSIHDISSKSGATTSSSQNSSHKEGRSIPAVQVLFSFISNQMEMLVTEEFIRNVFSEFGILTDVCIKKININKGTSTQNGYGFVHYECSHKGIQSALQAASWFHRRVVQNVKFDCKISHQFQQFLDDEENMKVHLGDDLRDMKEFSHSPPVQGGRSRSNRSINNVAVSSKSLVQQGQAFQRQSRNDQQRQNTVSQDHTIASLKSNMYYHAPVYPPAPMLMTPTIAPSPASRYSSEGVVSNLSSSFQGQPLYHTPVMDNQPQYPHVGMNAPYYNTSTTNISTPQITGMYAAPSHPSGQGYPSQVYVAVPPAAMMHYPHVQANVPPTPMYSTPNCVSNHFQQAAAPGMSNSVMLSNSSRDNSSFSYSQPSSNQQPISQNYYQTQNQHHHHEARHNPHHSYQH